MRRKPLRKRCAQHTVAAPVESERHEADTVPPKLLERVLQRSDMGSPYYRPSP